MKYIEQFLVILAFSFVGELLHEVIPFPIPGSIYGLLLLFVALVTKVVKLPQVQGAAKYLIEVMPLMFIPAGVGLLTSWDALQPILIQVVIIMLASTILVMGIAGKVTQWVIEFAAKKEEHYHE